MKTSTNLVYLPVYIQQVDNITVSVVDQEDDTVNFGGEVIAARLQLKLVMGLTIRSEEENEEEEHKRKQTKQ